MTSLKGGKLVNDNDSVSERMDTEQVIKDALRPLIDKVAKGWINGAKPSDAEVLGVIVSKFLEWDAKKIMEASHSAFEDSNFDARIELDV